MVLQWKKRVSVKSFRLNWLNVREIVLAFFTKIAYIKLSGIGAVGSALVLGTRGREFESRIPDQRTKNKKQKSGIA